MSFETPKKRGDQAEEASIKLDDVIASIGITELEKAIRTMSLTGRENLYKAVEMSKKTT